MSRSAVISLLVVIILAFCVFLLWHYKYGVPTRPVTLPPIKPKPEAKTIYLYFVDMQTFKLVAEERKIRKGNLVVEMEATLRELSAGPGDLSLHNAVPPYEICFRKVFKKGNCTYVDLHKEMQYNRLRENYFEGSMEELGVYSIVNTLIKSFPQIKKVQILVEGKPADTLTGHMGINQPLQFDSTLIKANE